MGRVITSLQKSIETIWQGDEWETYLKDLSTHSGPITEQLLELGSYCAEKLDPAPKEMSVEVLECYLVSFLWVDRAKSFLILWRDICFEQNKAYLFFLEKEISESDLHQLRADSKEVISKANNALNTFFREQKDEMLMGEGQEKQQLERWSFQQNPWPVYAEQLADLQKQCASLFDEYSQLRDTQGAFSKIHALVEEAIENCEEEETRLKNSFQDLEEFIAKSLDDSQELNPGKIVTYIESLEEDPSQFGPVFSERLDALIKPIEENLRVPIEVEYGLIQFRDIPFQKSVQRWLESEILPLLYEIWELIDSIKLEEKKTRINIRNRAILIRNEMKELNETTVKNISFSPSLDIFSRHLDQFEENYTLLKNQILDRMDLDFQVSKAFFPKREFLSVPIQYTLNTLRIGQGEFYSRAQDWLEKQTDRIWKIGRKVREEDRLSSSEKMVRYLQSRQTQPENQHYSSIFLTKGYVGESFWVGRKDPLQHTENLINNWKKGFRGAIILTGARLSGRSFFGEMVANRYFPENTLKLKPETELEVEGRKLSVGYELEEALQFIKKYSLQSRPLIWIDDLELWCSPSISLGKNIRSLLELIDSHSHHMFFMVSMTNWAKARMDPFFKIDQAFQAKINLNRMAPQEIGEAILIRHGATHETLLDVKGMEVSPQKLRKLIKRIIGVADGNIGDALNLWAASIEKIEGDKEKVRFQFRSIYGLPEFKGPDSLLLLSSILLEKQTNEYRLSKLYGPAFQHSYSHILQRLLNIGLVTRRADGMLQINELAVNDVAQFLFRMNYIKFTS